MSNTFKLPAGESFKEQLKAACNTNADLSDITWQDMETAIGRNAEKYRPLWERISSSGKKGFFAQLSPCWSAIPFLGVSWAVARRMYPLAVTLLAAMAILNIASPDEAGAARVLGMAILISFTFKSVYLRWLACCIRHIDKQGFTEQERETALRQIGGLDQKSGWVAAGALITVNVVVAVLIGMFG